ncbi:hypothetical protein DJ568_02205 [Mucilaginibacter hurinus]|uniref:DUF4397 domain-containing protein n=1 Tax=Mucilaginibacter hurinus TaxID=2201324 RepID=A0A367GTS5_9SPHI|nr:DUF4397 domain-containing protein [Mucilaginibacter hurinus]RCH56690.1 hypothetical protein DJ568_02205 [Mucilaginibacter hurinus]
MGKNNNSRLLVTLSLFTFGLIGLPLLFTSCGKQGNINPVEAKIEYQVLNLSYDILPVNLYVDFLKQTTSPVSYPNSSGYISLNTIDTPFQIRSANIASVTNLLVIDSTKLSRRTKYSVFITGSRENNTLTYIFTVDSSTVPRVGRGKIRFVNAALPVGGTERGLDLTANDTVAFSQHTYKKVSDYVELSAGLYNLRIRPSAKPSETLAELPRTNIEDGKLYTIYTYGLAGRIDTAAFGAKILTNR